MWKITRLFESFSICSSPTWFTRDWIIWKKSSLIFWFKLRKHFYFQKTQFYGSVQSLDSLSFWNRPWSSRKLNKCDITFSCTAYLTKIKKNEAFCRKISNKWNWKFSFFKYLTNPEVYLGPWHISMVELFGKIVND